MRAFCSYTHEDNITFSRAIEYLVEDLRSLHEAETGRTLEIFLDRTSIGWGGDIRSAVSDSVENATFFVPVITARYFQSSWCRDELLSFYGKCQALGVTELILPVVLAGKSKINEDSEDEVIRIVARVRYIDWTSTWVEGRGSAAWNVGVRELVRRLVELQGSVEPRLIARAQSTINPPTPNDSREAGGGNPTSFAEQLERLRTNGTALEATRVVVDFQIFLEDLRRAFDVLEIGDEYAVMHALDRLGLEFAARGHDLERDARAAVEQMVEFDATLRGTIRGARRLASREQLTRLKAQLDSLRTTALELGQLIRDVNSMSDLLRRFGDTSVGLRVSLSPARAGLQSVRDIARILDGWVSLEL